MTKKPKRRRLPAGFDEPFELFARRCGNPACRCVRPTFISVGDDGRRRAVHAPWSHLPPCPLAPIYAEWTTAARDKWARLQAVSPAPPVDISYD